MVAVISAGGISGGSDCGCASCGKTPGLSRVSQRMPASGARNMSTRALDATPHQSHSPLGTGIATAQSNKEDGFSACPFFIAE